MTPDDTLKRESAKARDKALEEALALQIRAAKLTAPLREHKPIEGRQWRCDFCWPDRLVAVEVEGGIWNGGRHIRPAGFEADAEKYNAMAIAGWAVLRVTPGHIKSGQALQWIQRLVR